MAFPSNPSNDQVYVTPEGVSYVYRSVHEAWFKFGNHLTYSNPVVLNQSNIAFNNLAIPQKQLSTPFVPNGDILVFITCKFANTVNLNIENTLTFNMKFYDSTNTQRFQEIKTENRGDYGFSDANPSIDFSFSFKNATNFYLRSLLIVVSGKLDQRQSGPWISSTWQFTTVDQLFTT